MLIFKPYHPPQKDFNEKSKQERNTLFKLPLHTPYIYTFLIYIKTNFIDWKYNANNTLTPLTEVTVIPNLKFIGKTIYTDNFGGNQPKEDIEDRKFAINWAKRPNLKWPDFPLVDETSN